MEDMLKINGTKQEDKFKPFAPPQSSAPTNAAPEDNPVDSAPQARDASTEAAEEHVEVLLDKSIEATFPASDPIGPPATAAPAETQRCRDPQEDLLDEAIELTFPASDPIAISVYAELVAGAGPSAKIQERAAQ